MPIQKYAALRSEEDGEEPSLQKDFRTTIWRSSTYNIRHLIINAIVFTTGLSAGWLLKSATPHAPNDQLAQYSMVPCKSTYYFPTLPSQTNSLIRQAPAFEAISSQPLTLTHHELEGHAHKSPYQGYPHPETTALWMDLMDGYSIRVPSSSLDALNLQSIPLNDNSGDVWVSMNVYHHLHCLDSIRHQIAGVGCHAADGNATHHEAEKEDPYYFPPHIDHCIETLRKRLICQPDLGVRAIAWNEDKPGVAFANNTVDSACVNWDAVQEWTRGHSFTEGEKLITTPEGEELLLSYCEVIANALFEGHIYRGPNTPPARCGQ